MGQKNSFLPLIVAVVLMLGIAYLVRPTGPVSAPISDRPAATEEQITGMLGVIDSVASDESFFSVVLPDGGIEEIVVPENERVGSDQVGNIARIDGMRDLSTRRISAQTIAIESEQNIYVTSPDSGGVVTSPLIVFGFGRVFEQTLDWRVKDNEGNIVREGFAMTHARDVGMYGPFRFDVFLPVMSGKEFVLEVFQYSARDGSEESLVSVALTLLTDNQTAFDTYFSTDARNCQQVTQTPRTVSNTSAAPRAALLELLSGPTDAEKQEGFTTRIPSGVRLYTLAISEGEARADFSAELGEISRACDRERAFAQISETLLQFESVEEVTISADGEVLATFK